MKAAKTIYEPFAQLDEQLKYLDELVDMAEDEGDEVIAHIAEDVAVAKKKIDGLEFKRLLGRKEDRANAILSINAGAGGTESCDWTSMLLRMYSRWADTKGHGIQQVDLLPGEEAGVKNVTIIIKGLYAYGYLKSEKGVHRLVRVSPFDSNQKRHTSFASVDVIPEVADDIDIVINESDLRIDTYRSGGAGGQHVNVTDSAVRITHSPSGLIVQCQNERSQHKNRMTAMKVLKARLYEREREKRQKEVEKQYGEKKDIAWGSQIRSCVMHPYSMVKDHRTKCETSNVDRVMDGALDPFMEAYLKWKASVG